MEAHYHDEALAHGLIINAITRSVLDRRSAHPLISKLTLNLFWEPSKSTQHNHVLKALFCSVTYTLHSYNTHLEELTGPFPGTVLLGAACHVLGALQLQVGGHQTGRPLLSAQPAGEHGGQQVRPRESEVVGWKGVNG
jgi:hypothetical protein